VSCSLRSLFSALDSNIVRIVHPVVESDGLLSLVTASAFHLTCSIGYSLLRRTDGAVRSWASIRMYLYHGVLRRSEFLRPVNYFKTRMSNDQFYVYLQASLSQNILLSCMYVSINAGIFFMFTYGWMSFQKSLSLSISIFNVRTRFENS
jgi:hypothetical protein